VIKKVTAWLVLVSLFSFILPQNISAKSGSPKIFVKYKTASTACRATTNDQISTFAWAGFKMQSGVTGYKINYTSATKIMSRNSIQATVDLAFSNIQGAANGILFRYDGESREVSATNDSQNTIMWKSLPSYVVAMTYVWLDGNNRLVDADTIFNSKYRWSNTAYNGSNDCGGLAGSFDFRNIATHEFGHWTGLGDLYNASAKDLTMYGYAGTRELKKDSLGLGDTIGIRSVWP